MTVQSYAEFIRAKIPVKTEARDIAVEAPPHSLLKPHQVACSSWLVAGGRRALFASFGLGKSIIQMDAIRRIIETHGGRGLIVIPLGVRQEFVRDAGMLGVPVRFIRRIEEADETGIYLTNYETVRDGKLDPRAFTAASLDEAAILIGLGGSKTFREFMRLFEGVRYKFVATATPSPNEYIELLAYAAFLEVMQVSEAKTRFFKRDSTNADNLTLHPHKAEEFWIWVASWALFLQKPSDLGYSDEGYALPPMKVIYHRVVGDQIEPEADRGGQLMLIPDAAIGVQGASKAKRETLGARIDALIDIVSVITSKTTSSDGNAIRAQQTILRSEPRSPESAVSGLVSCEQRKDRSVEAAVLHEGISENIPAEEEDTGRGSRAEPVAEGEIRLRRSLSRKATGEGTGEERSKPSSKAIHPPECGVWPDGGGLPQPIGEAERGLRDLRGSFDWRSSEGQSGEVSGSGPLPQDEVGSRNSLSQLQRRSRAVQGRSGSPDASDRISEQIVIWCDLNAEQRAIEAELNVLGVSYVSLDGSQSIDEREALIAAWRRREACVFLSKPTMYGAGVNLQQACKMAFVGIGFKFRDFIQSIHRVYRFLQKHEVEIHIIYAEREQAILRTLLRKWEQHNQLVAKMSEIIQNFGLSHAAMAKALERSIGCKRIEVSSDKYRLVNADTVEETARMPADSVGLIVTSIPFSSQYEYTPSFNDFGHTDNDAHFWAQMDFLIPQLYRVLKPGRLAAIHVKDRIIPGGISGLGFQTLSCFGDDCRSAFRKHGFAHLGTATITTDVVRENNQTYRLGWTEQCKDGSRMGFGVPEQLILFRKPPTSRENGYADDPVLKAKKWRVDEDLSNGVEAHWLNDGGYSRARWQLDAHGYHRSDGNRLLRADEILGFEASDVYKKWKAFSLSTVYNFEHHVKICEAFEERGNLPATFMLLPPHVEHPQVWTDITRMLGTNTLQSAAGKELHLCPLQWNIVDRAINQWSNPGDVVFDPFGGLMTVPMRAVKYGRIGWGNELNHGYFLDGCAYVKAEVEKVATPSLFDALEASGAPVYASAAE